MRRMRINREAGVTPSRNRAYRSEYQRDRDRIVHSTAFRRLVYKTQVFVNHEGDLYRTRLTHSLEVAQIARTIARALDLNEVLSEAICLAHDLGHTPFGHAGQDALNECMREFGGFEHNLQSLRVVDELEEHYAEFDGLNLTFECREGILKHCSYNNAHQARRGGRALHQAAATRAWRRSSPISPMKSPTTITMWTTAFAPVSSAVEQLLEVPLFCEYHAEVRERYPETRRPPPGVRDFAPHDQSARHRSDRFLGRAAARIGNRLGRAR